MKANGEIKKIDGAVLMPQLSGDGNYIFPECDYEYKYLIITDEMSERKGLMFPFVSKDFKKWVIPASVNIGGEFYKPLDLLETD